MGKLRNGSSLLKSCPLKSEEDIIFCSNWITVCVMLHNFALDYDDKVLYVMDQPSEIELDGEDLDDEVQLEVPNINGEEKRQWLFGLLNSHSIEDL